MLKIDKDSPRPFYLQLKEELKSAIASGQFQPNDPIPEERKLATDLELSRMTVRRAIMELTAEGLFQRIRGRGTFVAGPRNKGKTRKAGAKATAGIVMPFGQAELRQSFFYYRILESLQEASGELGLALSFHTITPPIEKFARDLVGDASLDALVILGIVDQRLLKLLCQQGLPAVLVDSAQAEGLPPSDYVSHTSEESAYRAVLHLLELGHRDIAMLSYGPTPAALEREAGYTRALFTRGIRVRPERLVRTECNGAGAYAATRNLLKDALPTALFCGSDEMALGALSAIKDQGLRVPQDLSLIGFGDLGYFSQPALSSVRIPVEAIGRKAAEILRARIDAPNASVVRHVFTCEFIARASSDLPRA